MSGVYDSKNVDKTFQIQAQNKLLKDEYETKRHISQSAEINDTKAQYQTEMYDSLKTVNTYLLFLYYLFFIVIHVLFAEQYFRGIPRNDVADAIWFTIFFIYPAVIYYVEMYIYSGIMYILSFVYGNSYVYNFDKALLNTSFYLAPNENTTNTASPSAIVNIT